MQIFNNNQALNSALNKLSLRVLSRAAENHALEIKAQKEAQDAFLKKQKEKAEIPERYLNSSFDNFTKFTADKVHVENLVDYSKRLKIKLSQNIKQGETVLILGGNGCGKTHLGVSILNKIDYQGLYISSKILCMRLIRSRAYKALKSEESLIKEISSVPFLVIDEIGRARDAETEYHSIYDILNFRYEKKLDTCLISNKDRADIQNYLGNAIMDRISEGFIILELKSGSYRRYMAEQRKGAHVKALES